MSVPGGTRPLPRTLTPDHGARQPGAEPGRRPRLTGRGAVLVMIVVFLAGCLIAAWSHLNWPAGLAYAAGCLLAAGYARREALLVVVITPPIIFATALVAAQLLTAGGSTLLATAEGTILVLAAVAPWLFCATAACLVVAVLRGLPRCIRDLRAQINGRGAARR